MDLSLTLEKIIGREALEKLLSALGGLSGTSILFCDPEGRPVAGDMSTAGAESGGLETAPLMVNGERLGTVLLRRKEVPAGAGGGRAGDVAGVLAFALEGAYRSSITAGFHEEVLAESYRQAEESNRKLVDALAAAKAAGKLKSTFLATVSHELKTPLTSVLGYSEMLISGGAGELNEQQIDCVRAIREKGGVLAEMVSGILEITRLEAGVVTLDLVRSSIAPMVMDVVEAYRQKAFEKGITIRINVHKGLPPVDYDPQKLWQVLKCLVDNAVKFSHAGSEIVVAASMEELKAASNTGRFGGDPKEFIAVSVSDGGPGMDPEQGARIFETFYQVDGSHTREHGGLGMGLRLVKGYVELHGGSVEVETAPGRGSTFTVRLPIKSRDAKQTQENT